MNEQEVYKQLPEMNLDTFEHPYNTEQKCSEFIGSLVAMTGAKVVIEVGIFEGRTSLELIKALPKGGKLILIDLNDNRCDALKSACSKRKDVEFIQGDSIEVLRSLKGVKADLIFYDSVHEYGRQIVEFKAGEGVSHDKTMHAFHDSIHLPQIKAFVDWMRRWYDVVNLNTPEGRGLAVGVRK